MNCQECQERLDERLDDLRAPLLRGEMAGESARARALLLLEKVARDCPDCAGELRAHLEVRLALMAPGAAPTVPPTLRANVRRALERESPARQIGLRGRAVGRWTWAGGAVASAALLFLVARPFLIERAETSLRPPVSDTAQTGAAPPAAPVVPKPSSALTQSKAASKAPPPAPKPVAPKPTSAPPPPKLAVPPPPFVAPRAGQIAPLLPPSPKSSPQFAAPMPPAPSQKRASAALDPHQNERRRESLVPPTAPPAPKAAPAKPPAPDMTSARAPRLSSPTIRAPQPLAAPGAPASPFGGAKARAPRADTPTEPRLDAKLLAPTGRALGLRVVFETSVASVAGNVGAFKAPAAPAPALPPPASQSADAPVFSAKNGSGAAAPDAARGALSDANGAAMDAAASAADAPALAQRETGTMMRSAPRGAAKPDTLFARRQKRALAKVAAPAPLLSLSVEHAVTGARVTGKIAGRTGDAKILWTGDLAANRAVSIPLSPLAPASGDTVDVAVEQQISLGGTKTLAGATVRVP